MGSRRDMATTLDVWFFGDLCSIPPREKYLAFHLCHCYIVRKCLTIHKENSQCLSTVVCPPLGPLSAIFQIDEVLWSHRHLLLVFLWLYGNIQIKLYTWCMHVVVLLLWNVFVSYSVQCQGPEWHYCTFSVFNFLFSMDLPHIGLSLKKTQHL